MTEDNQEDNQVENKSNIFSIRLISGERILTELGLDEDHNDFLVMFNPIIVTFIDTPEGISAIGTEFDPLTDESMFFIPFDRILSQPVLASYFYCEFYARSLILSYIKRIRLFLSSQKDNISSAEFAKLIDASNNQIQEYVTFISEKFSVSISSVSQELHIIKPENTILH
jgi:hypothetical protein